jgi:4-amino-4-deoxy-L-arabinose transferase-like glycosyltransferase
MALSYKAFGVNEFAARFSGAFLAVLLVLATYFFLARNLRPRIALYGALILITAPMCIGVARMAITDMPLAFFTGGGLMSLFTAFKTKNRLLERLGYLLVGLAVMTKGPVGAILPALILIAYYLLNGKVRDAIKFFNLPLAFVIVAAVSLPWFIVEIYLTKGAYFREFIVRENFERFTSVVDAHKGGWWYHLLAVTVGMFPWSVFLPQSIFLFFQRAWKRWSAIHSVSEKPRLTLDFSEKIHSVRKFFACLSGRDSNDEIRLFAMCWALITIVFYSVSVSKLLPYTLPAFPALATLVAIELDEGILANRPTRLLMPLLIIAIVFGGAAAYAKEIFSHLRDAPESLYGLVATFATFGFWATLAALVIISFGWRRQGVACFILTLIFSILYFGQQLLPILSKAFEGGVPAYARYAARSTEPIVVFDLRKPAIPFYTRRKVIQPADRNSLKQRLRALHSAYIITRVKNLDLLEAAKGYQEMSKDSRYVFLHWQQGP